MKYLSLADLMAAAAFALDAPVEVRDWGLLESALARPRTSVFGEDAYVTVWDKAAALLHSLVRNHALVDGNERLGITATALLLHRNGIELSLKGDEAYDLVIAAAEGRLDVPDLAVALHRWAA